jgi:NAD(P)H-hydrate epimerase
LTKILTSAEIREIDRISTEKFGIAGVILMENAGMRVVEAIDARVDELEAQSVAILCGKGNNGGDGFVVARQLMQRGCFPAVFLFASPTDVTADARTNLDILSAIGYPPVVIQNEEEWSRALPEILDADIVVDALLGTGLSKPVEGLLRKVVDCPPDARPTARIWPVPPLTPI